MRSGRIIEKLLSLYFVSPLSNICLDGLGTVRMFRNSCLQFRVVMEKTWHIALYDHGAWAVTSKLLNRIKANQRSCPKGNRNIAEISICLSVKSSSHFIIDDFAPLQACITIKCLLDVCLQYKYIYVRSSKKSRGRRMIEQIYRCGGSNFRHAAVLIRCATNTNCCCTRSRSLASIACYIPGQASATYQHTLHAQSLTLLSEFVEQNFNMQESHLLIIRERSPKLYCSTIHCRPLNLTSTTYTFPMNLKNEERSTQRLLKKSSGQRSGAKKNVYQNIDIHIIEPSGTAM